MSKTAHFPLVDVAVTLITRGEQFLAVYNRNWDCFTFPMTKRRDWHDPRVPGSLHHEEWIDAAARAAAEWLGRTCVPQFVWDDVGEYQQSDRDGQWKRYHFQVFRVPVEGDRAMVPGTITEWLTPTDFLERRPISASARYVLGRLQEQERLQVGLSQSSRD
jgi:hypothetical protein